MVNPDMKAELNVSVKGSVGALAVLTLELAADRWVQKDDHWYWFKADGIMVHSEWLSYMGHWYYVTYSHHLANA